MRNLSQHTAVFLLILLLVSCSRDSSPSRLHNVFGADDRKPVVQNQSPYNSVGRLDIGCTGSLVGRNLVLTAGHCVVQPGGKAFSPGWFRPLFRGDLESAKYRATRIWYASRYPEQERSKDWAVLQLDTPAGDAHGWLPLQTIEVKKDLPLRVSLLGYSEDGQHLRQVVDCQLLKADSKDRILNNCDSTSGVSGGPFIVKSASKDARPSYAIVAMAVSELRKGAPDSLVLDQYQDDFANLAIADSQVVKTVETLRLTIDRGLPSPSMEGVIESVLPRPE